MRLARVRLWPRPEGHWAPRSRGCWTPRSEVAFEPMEVGLEDVQLDLRLLEGGKPHLEAVN